MTTYLPTVRPDCCICDPDLCLADDTGEHCNDQSCGTCLHGCPAPDGECCNTVRADGLDELAAWYAANAVHPKPSRRRRLTRLFQLVLATWAATATIAFLIWSLA